MELQNAKQRFEERGLKLAAISYDSQAILNDFAARHNIDFPLLADPDSKIIRSFGVLNAEAKGMNQRQEDNRFARNVAWGVFCGLWLFAATACAVGAFLWRFLLGPFNV